MIPVWLVGVVAFLLSFIWLNGRRRPRGFPPGPMRLPLLGNLPQIITCGAIDKFLNKYRDIYGELFSFEMGGQPIVVASGYEMVHELWITQGNKTSLRSPHTMTKFIEERNSQYPGVVFGPDPYWRTIRSSVLTILRDEGMGKRSSEEKIMEEIESYISYYIGPHIGKPVETESFKRFSSNVISQMVFERRFDYDSKEQKILVESIHTMMSSMGQNAVTKNIPFLHLLPNSSLKMEKYLMDEVIIPTIGKVEEQSIQQGDEGQTHPTNRLMNLITKQNGDEGLPSYHTRKNAHFALEQLYGAGTETTAKALRWILLYMCLYPRVQDLIHQEIDNEIGYERQISHSDRLKLHYVEAVILESMRNSNQAATLLPRTVSADIHIKGMIIPAGTQLMCNAGSVVHDEEVFPEPNSFRPERFLEGDTNLKKQRVITFGLGKRRCIGEGLARMEQFLMFSTLMQRYSVRLSDCSQTVTDTPVLHGIGLAPQDHKIIFTLR